MSKVRPDPSLLPSAAPAQTVGVQTGHRSPRGKAGFPRASFLRDSQLCPWGFKVLDVEAGVRGEHGRLAWLPLMPVPFKDQMLAGGLEA